MRLDEIIQEEPLTRSDQMMGLSQYENSRFILAGGFRSGSSGPGTTRLKYVIYDLEIFEETGDEKAADVGFIEVFASDETKEIVGLVNIVIKPKFRKSGYGSKLIQDLKDTVKDGFDLHDIQKKAVGFWKKVGTEFSNSRNTSGRIHNNEP